MNTQFNYIIIEDEPIQQDRLKGIIEMRPDWNANLIGAFEEPMEAYRFLQNPDLPPIDILFLDMALPNEESGLAFINSIKNFKNEPWILIVSGHNQLKELFAHKIKHLIGDYVNKPYTAKVLTDAVEYLLNQQKNKILPIAPTESSLTLNYTENNQRVHKVFKVEELVFFRTSQDNNKKIEVGTTEGNELINGPLKDILKELNALGLKNFIQIARDCIVHLNFIKEYSGKTLIYVLVPHPINKEEKIELIVAPSFRDQLRKKLEK